MGYQITDDTLVVNQSAVLRFQRLPRDAVHTLDPTRGGAILYRSERTGQIVVSVSTGVRKLLSVYHKPKVIPKWAVLAFGDDFEDHVVAWVCLDRKLTRHPEALVKLVISRLLGYEHIATSSTMRGKVVGGGAPTRYDHAQVEAITALLS